MRYCFIMCLRICFQRSEVYITFIGTNVTELKESNPHLRIRLWSQMVVPRGPATRNL